MINNGKCLVDLWRAGITSNRKQHERTSIPQKNHRAVNATRISPAGSAGSVVNSAWFQRSHVADQNPWLIPGSPGWQLGYPQPLGVNSSATRVTQQPGLWLSRSKESGMNRSELRNGLLLDGSLVFPKSVLQIDGLLLKMMKKGWFGVHPFWETTSYMELLVNGHTSKTFSYGNVCRKKPVLHKVQHLWTQPYKATASNVWIDWVYPIYPLVQLDILSGHEQLRMQDELTHINSSSLRFSHYGTLNLPWSTFINQYWPS